MLKQLFPDKKIIGTNLSNTDQFKFCLKMSKNYNFKLFESEHDPEIKNIDLVFASEYFEHIFDASVNIQKLINKLNPKFLFLANTFRQKSVGHFNIYKISSTKFVKNTQISRIFNNVLKKNGYIKIKTGLWNDRPNLWEKKEQ